MSSPSSRRRNNQIHSKTLIEPAAIFRNRRRLSAANGRGRMGQSGKRRSRSRQSTFPATSKRAEEALMNPELLGCHFGSGDAIGYLLKRDVTSVIG